MSDKVKTKAKTKQKVQKTKSSSLNIFWGLVSLLPFGFIILWYSIFKRRDEAEHGIRSKESAKKSISYYLVGIFMSFMLILFLLSNTKEEVVRNFIPQFVTGSSEKAFYLIVWPLVKTIFLTCIASNNLSRLEGKKEKKGDDWMSYEEIYTMNRGNQNKLSNYEAGIEELRDRLESLDSEDENLEAELRKIKVDLNKFVSKNRNISPEEGCKYKLYELMAEYYFVAGSKQQAKKYIDMAIKIKEQEEK